ncbi:MAG: LCCL domain-containing protein [Pseudomonadota bacterium]
MKTIMKALLFTCALIGAGPGHADMAEPEVPRIDWETTINHFQIDSDKFIGQRLSVDCPEWTAADDAGVIYGTDLYSSDSAICIAAQHAGAITESGGRATLQLMPSPEAYQGLVQNGVRSQSRPATDRSIAFVTTSHGGLDAVRNEYAPRIDWDTKFTRTGLANRDLVGQHFTFHCPQAPADMRARRVVGTDRYAFDSMICRAAVHAGQLSLSGGPVTLRMEPGGKDLIGSKRNGIETKNGSSVVRTVTFVER